MRRSRGFLSALAPRNIPATAPPSSTCPVRLTTLFTTRNAAGKRRGLLAALLHESELAIRLLPLCLTAGGFAGLGGVVAFAVDGRNFGAHAPQVGRKLPAVMNGMDHAEHYEGNGRALEHAAKIHHLHELVTGELRQGLEIHCEPLLIPSRDFLRSLYAIGQSGGVDVEDA